MTRLRQGFLSDESMMKECMLHHPVPMNRLDLLPRPMENRSGLYYRPLKETKIIARPESAGVMLDSAERLTGNNLKEDYMSALKEEPKIVKFPTYPNTLPDTRGIPVAPNVGNAYSIATITYAALANQVGIPTSLSSGMSSSFPSPPVSVGDSATTLSEGDSATIPESLSSEPELTEMPMGTQTGESGREVIPTTEPPIITRGRIPSRPVQRPVPQRRASDPRLPGETFPEYTQRLGRETLELMRRETLPPLMEMGEEQQIEIQQKPRPPLTREQLTSGVPLATQRPDLVEARRRFTRQEPRPVMREIRQIL